MQAYRRLAAISTMLALVSAGGATTARSAGATTPVYFGTLKPGSSLPSDAQCAAEVRPVASEPRPANTVANHTVPPPGGFKLAPMNDQNGYDNRAQRLEDRVTGNFTGTTDEIIQWAACKWGIGENVVRAIAMTESDWNQSETGDFTDRAASCPPGYSVPCPQSFGIHQVTWTGDPVGSFPWSRDSTAFNLDLSLMVHRVCYEGYTWYLRDIGYSSYAAGDLWGCVGQWYSGNWHDPAAQSYIATVKGYLATQPWNSPGFADPAAPTSPTCPCMRYDFENGTAQGWYPSWGQVSVANTTSEAHTGTHGLAIDLHPSGADWPGVETAFPSGLASGKQVTYWLYEPSGSTLQSVQPYVADLSWNDVMVAPVALEPGWNEVSWTVPSVNGVDAVGMEINNGNGWNGQLVLDSVSW